MWRDLKSVFRTLVKQPLVATVVVGNFGVSILACLVPARRATRTDPVTLLKAE